MAAERVAVMLGADDYPAIRQLWESAGLSIRPTGRDSQEGFAIQLARGTQAVFGIQDRGTLVGVIIATHDGRKGWLNRLAILPDYRRQGAARFLIAQAEQWLSAQGIQITAALIEDWNSASLALFEQAGYVVHPDIHYVTKRDAPDV